MTADVFSLQLPKERRTCAIFNSPHSGSDYGATLTGQSRLTTLQLRSSEDAFVDDLFGSAPELGAPLLAARVPRAFVDLNRAADDLDPALIIGASRRFLNPRIAAGLGVIPRVVAEGRPIVDGKLPLAEAQRRIATYYDPYHSQLRSILEESRTLFGMGILFDCHSMPHDALASAPSVWGRRPNVILGDRFGAACDRWLMDAATDVFTAAGFVVARNAPFAGGYITQSYGQPRLRLHALQIEIDRALYMDELKIDRLPSFENVRTQITRAMLDLVRLGPCIVPMAAE